MVIRKQGQRRGRVFHWMAGVLAVSFLGLIGYQWWINRDWQTQDDERIDELLKAKLDSVKAQPADPHDWPQWRGPHRDATAPGDDLLTTWPEGGLQRLWKVKGGGGFSALSVAAGRA